MENDSHVNYFT